MKDIKITSEMVSRACSKMLKGIQPSESSGRPIILSEEQYSRAFGKAMKEFEQEKKNAKV